MTEYTVKEYARIERVTERTVRTWMSKGAIEFRRTPGQRIRIIERSNRVVMVNMKPAEDCGSFSA